MRFIVPTPTLPFHRLVRWCNDLHGGPVPGYPDYRVKRILKFQFFVQRSRYYGLLLVEVTTAEERQRQAPRVEVYSRDEANGRLPEWERVNAPWVALVWLPGDRVPVTFGARTAREAERAARGWLKDSRIGE